MITKPKLIATPTWPSAPVWASTMIAPQPAKTRAKVPTNSAASSCASERSIVIPDRSARGSALVGQELRDQPLHTPIELLERDDGVGVDLPGRGRAGRADPDPPLGAESQEPGRHLAAAGVVHADEQDFHRILVHRKPPPCRRRSTCSSRG